MTEQKKVGNDRRRKQEEHINETLIFMFQHDIEDTFEILYKRCESLLWRAVYKNWQCFERSREDLWQEASLCFVCVTKKYKRDKKMCFSQFVSLSLDNHFSSLRRMKFAKKRKADSNAISLDHLCEQKGIYVMGIAKDSSPLDALLIEETMQEFQKHLSAFEKKVVMLFAKGYSYDSIAEHLDCSREKVMNAKHRCTQKYKSLFLDK
ncbi:RNA polymerase sigma factor [Marinilactibacillus kalidii]|uniref:RNA polymerase sigma factor n=1 Tax=Marinilactibacillus kalidii TaxID=2820274 RepID=UPI001ABE7FF4|nr:hypothetical protein [Marinilactibacillus kalidii]